LYSTRAHRYLHSFPTRRSSDLPPAQWRALLRRQRFRQDQQAVEGIGEAQDRRCPERQPRIDVAKQATQRRAQDKTGAEGRADPRSEEHTSELQSLAYLVCRLLL